MTQLARHRFSSHARCICTMRMGRNSRHDPIHQTRPPHLQTRVLRLRRSRPIQRSNRYATGYLLQTHDDTGKTYLHEEEHKENREYEMTDTYQGPFEYDPYSQMIECKTNPHIVGQVDWVGKKPEETTLMLIRGWGGLHSTFGMAQGALIQDAFGRRVAELLNTHGVGDEVTELMKGHK